MQDNLIMLRQLGIITDEELATAVPPIVATAGADSGFATRSKWRSR